MRLASEGVRAIAVFEGLKGVVVLLAGFGVLSLIHRDLQHAAEVIVHHLHLDPAKHYPRIFIDAAGRISEGRVAMLAAGALAYCSVRFIEAYGLWRQRAWAEWFAAVSGGIYIPFEVLRLLHGHGWISALALVINVAIVAFMVYALRRRAPRHGG